MNGGLVRRRVLNRSVEGEHGINTPGEKEAWDRAGTVKGRTGRGRLASSDYLDETGAASLATPYALSDRANGDRQLRRRLGQSTGAWAGRPRQHEFYRFLESWIVRSAPGAHPARTNALPSPGRLSKATCRRFLD